jgi:putative transposase
MPVLISLLTMLSDCGRSRVALQLELLALRHQLRVLKRSRGRRLRLACLDRLLWASLSRTWSGWRDALVIVTPETVIAWHRRGFRLFWAWKSRHRMGRPIVGRGLQTLIRTMSEANPLWGAPTPAR